MQLAANDVEIRNIELRYFYLLDLLLTHQLHIYILIQYP